MANQETTLGSVWGWLLAVGLVCLAVGSLAAYQLFPQTVEVEKQINNTIEIPATYLTIDDKDYTAEDVKSLLADKDYFDTEYNDEEREKAAYTIVTKWAEDNFEDELEYQLMQFFGLADKDDLSDYDFELTYESSKFANFDWDDEDVNVAIDGTITFENKELMQQGEMTVFIAGTYEEDDELDNEFIQIAPQ